jgi:hypothetical protein
MNIAYHSLLGFIIRIFLIFSLKFIVFCVEDLNILGI